MTGIKGGEISEGLMHEVDNLWREYEKHIAWKVNQLEDKRHGVVCSGLKNDGWCACRTRQQEIHEWEDWYIENGDRALGEIDWSIPEAVLKRVQVPQGMKHGTKKNDTSGSQKDPQNTPAESSAS